MIGEQPLQVVLTDGEGHARGRPRRTRDTTGSPPARAAARQQRGQTDEPVDAHLDDDTRHERRDVAGARRVRAGQPDVEAA